jgi:hypothetical protein
MAIREQLRDVLVRVADRTKNNVNKDVPDTWIIDEISLPAEEMRSHIDELISLGLLREPFTRMNRTADEQGREYRLIGITKEGLKELTPDQELRKFTLRTLKESLFRDLYFLL